MSIPFPVTPLPGKPLATTGLSTIFAVSSNGVDIVRSAIHYANPVNYGADPTGVESSVSAFNAAKESGKAIKWSEGTFLIDSAISMPCGGVFQGAGLNKTFFKVTSVSFLLVNDGPNFSRSQVENFTVLAMVAPSSNTYGIKHTVSNFSPLRNSISIKNVQFRGGDDEIISDFGFHKYIWTSNTYGGEATNVRIEGCYQVTEDPDGQLDTVGMHISDQSVGFTAIHCNFNALHTHTIADEITEGANLIACEAVGCRDGYDMRGTRPGVWIAQSHANVARNGIWLDGRPQSNLVGNSIYRSSFFFQEDWFAIRGKDMVGLEAIGNEVVNSLLTGNATGLYLEEGNQLINVAGLTLRECTYGIKHETDGVKQNDTVNYTGISFLACDYWFSTASNDVRVTLGPHNGRGSNTQHYVLAGQGATINVQTARAKVNKVFGNATISAGATRLLDLIADSQSQFFTYSADTFTHYIDLDTANALNGDFWELRLKFTSSSINPTVVIRDSSGGSTLLTINPSDVATFSIRAEYANAWVIQSFVRNYDQLSGNKLIGVAPQLTINPASGNTGIEIGSTTAAGQTYFDFHSSGHPNDYDSRILAEDGTSGDGDGSLRVLGAIFKVDPTIALKDGITAPSTVTGYAQIYVDVADGDLKIKFGDGTVKTIVVDT